MVQSLKNKQGYVNFIADVDQMSSILQDFESVEKFDEFVKSFFLNEFTIAALPMLLEKEIFGFGFPLACDFLKELEYYQYGKPDVHLKNILRGRGRKP